MIQCDKTTCVYNEWNIINQTFCIRDRTTISKGKCVDYEKCTPEQQQDKRARHPYKKDGKNLY